MTTITTTIFQFVSIIVFLLIIARQLVVDRKIFKVFIVSLSYDNRKIFCKLENSRKSIVTLALS